MATIAICSAAVTFAENAAGDWTGILQFEEAKTPIRAHFELTEKGLEGKVSIPFEKIMDSPLLEARTESDQIFFSLKTETEPMRFEGKHSAAEITGTVSKGKIQGRMELVRVVATDPAKYFGIYQLAPNRFLYIRTWDELGENQLTFYEDAGKVGPLISTSTTHFFSGPGLWIPLPKEIEGDFLEKGGEITGLTWKEKGITHTASKLTDYREEKVRFSSGTIHLGGTLVAPSGPGPYPAVVFVHGSGPVTRDFYGPLPYHFVRHGIAVLTYDKRGIGESEGNWLDSGFDDLASDAVSAVEFLKTKKEIRASSIGLFGISQGGWIVPLAASRSSNIAFAILVSAAAVTPEEQQLMNVAGEMRAANMPEGEIQKAVSGMKEQIESLRSEEVIGSLEASVQKMKQEGKDALLAANGPENPKFILFFRRIMDFDPIPVLEKVKCPVLVLYGDLDRLVPVSENKDRLEAALRKAEHPNVTVRVFPKADHAMLVSETGSMKEFPFANQFAPGFFSTMTSWILEQTKKKKN